MRLIQSGTFQKVGSEQQQSVDVRFVCATNRDPLVEVREGRFREDLYYRLNVVPIDLPPLRDRGQDVLLIADKLLGKFNKEMGKSFAGFTDDAAEQLLNYNWPGNVRELQNVIENIVIMNTAAEITSHMLPEVIRRGGENRDASRGWVERRKNNLTMPDRRKADAALHHAVPAATTASPPLHLVSLDQIEPLWKTEKQVIEEAIRVCDGNVPQAAARLGDSPSTLYRKIKSWEKAS